MFASFTYSLKTLEELLLLFAVSLFFFCNVVFLVFFLLLVSLGLLGVYLKTLTGTGCCETHVFLGVQRRGLGCQNCVEPAQFCCPGSWAALVRSNQ